MRYQKSEVKEDEKYKDELMLVKLRYKKPNEDKSNYFDTIVKNNSESFDKSSENHRFAASVAMFGMILKNSKFKGESNVNKAIFIAENSLGKDEFGYRKEFVELMKKYQNMLNIDR